MASYDTRLDLQTSDDSSGHDDGMVDAAVDITSAPNGRDVEEPAVGIAGEASLRDLPKRVLRQSGLGAVQADGVPLNVRSPAERKSTAGPIDKSSILRSKQAEPLLTNGHGHASEHDRTLTEGLDTNVSTNSSAGTGTFAANAPVNGWKPASKRRLSRSEDVSLLETPNKRRSSDRQRQLEQSKDKSASDSSSPPQPSVAKSRPRITAAAPSSTGKGAKTDTAKVKADSARVKIDVTKAKTDMTKAKTDMAKVKTDMAKAKTVDAPGAHKAPSERKHNNDTKANGTIPNGAGVVEDVESLKLAKELAELEFGLRKRSR